ncbi:TolC family protein [Rubripirellula reticaptiva]|uniref:TolC family protein n=1 Tax=Rubripirellula reticaptiva TaxID=2528013 RepID=UPI001FE7B870|nr:TolC family protein [Rubripirellula reticaptiva]
MKLRNCCKPLLFAIGSMVVVATAHPSTAQTPQQPEIQRTGTPQPISIATLQKVWETSSTPIMVPPSSLSRSMSSFDDIPPPISHGPFDGQLHSYRARAYGIPDSPEPIDAQVIEQNPYSVVSLENWWDPLLAGPLGIAPQTMQVDVGGLAQTAIASSPYIRGILTQPHIRQNDLVIADANFDTLAFVEGKFADTSDPIGSLLTTGNAFGRYRDQTFSSSMGLRKKGHAGTQFELIQRGGFQDNNSTFLVPNPQGTTRLEVNVTQPLMKDRGRAVNDIRVLLARIDVQIATSEVRSSLESHLVDVSAAYWNLYQSRAQWLQRSRLLANASELSEILRARGEVDAFKRQILRADAAVASRRADLVRSETEIRNAQAQLRLLTGDPQLLQTNRWELLPSERPLVEAVTLSTRQATITALDNRTDIAESIRKVQATSAGVGVAKNQVLPRLDLILSTYVAGLDTNSNTFGAFENQFSTGRPSFAAGLLFERPVGNRAAEARLNRNRWELTRSIFEFQQAAETAFTEVEVAVRETHTAFNEMIAKKQAIDAANREVDYLKQRWQWLPDPNESAVLLIEDLLDAQERLTDEEESFVRAQVAYALSWVQLRRSMGVLLRFDGAGINGVPDEAIQDGMIAEELLCDPVDSSELESGEIVSDEVISQ